MSIVQESAGWRRFEAAPVVVGAALAAIGLFVWIGASAWGGMSAEGGFRMREAWDTPAYLTVGLPSMALAVAIAAFLSPEQIWRWPVALVTGHQAGVFVVGLGMQSGLSLVLLTLILGGLLAVCFAIPALLGSMLARRIAERAY